MNKRKIVLALALGISSAIGLKADAAANGWVLNGSTWNYYSSGKMYTGWLYDGGKWYYLDDNGNMKTGWIDYKEDKYYLRSDGSMATGWIKDEGYWYYFNSDGSLKTGLLVDGSNQYYLDKNDGRMLIGLIHDRDENPDDCLGYHYADSNGALKEGWVNIYGEWYYFLKNKYLAKSICVDGYYVNEKGIWDNTYDNKVAIFSDEFEDNASLTIVNCTKGRVKFNGDFKLERKSDDEWIPVGSKNDTENAGIEIAGGETKNINISLKDFEKRTDSGDYRIGIKLNDEYVYSEFNIYKDKDTIKIKMDEKLDLFSINAIPFTLINKSDEKMQYNPQCFLVANETSYSEKLELKNISKNKTDVLNPGESLQCSIPLNHLKEKLQPGAYKIIVNINGLEGVSNFLLSMDNAVEITTDKDSYQRDENSLTITITNKTNKDLSYNGKYKIEGLTNAFPWTWEELRSKENRSDKLTLKANDTVTEKIDISGFERNYKYSEYRITKEINGYECFVPFYYSDMLEIEY